MSSGRQRTQVGNAKNLFRKARPLVVAASPFRSAGDTRACQQYLGYGRGGDASLTDYDGCPPSMTALDRDILDLVDGYWNQFLGCSLDALRSKTAQVLAHAEHASYAGCYLIEFGAAPVISLRADEVTVYRAAVTSWGPGVVRTPALVEAVFRERVAIIIGPAFIGYTDLTHFRPVSPGGARPLSPGDEQGVKRLHDACTGEEWDHGAAEFRPNTMVGAFRDHRLVALASYEPWGKHLAHVSIVAHPFFRGQGYAEAAVSELTKIILERKLVPQYRTLDANDPSMAIAHRLGFFRHATSLAVRFKVGKVMDRELPR